MKSSTRQSGDKGQIGQKTNVVSAVLVGILCLVVILFSIFSCRNLSAVLSLGFLAAVAPGFAKRRSMKATPVLFFAWFVSLLTPIDITCRTANRFTFSCVPVVTASHSHQGVRDLESRGLVQNRDFVVYKRNSEFTRVRWALLVTIPIEKSSSPR